MAIVIVATPGDPTANSYVDMTYANAYANSRLGSSDWVDGDDDDKVIALVQATRVLDSVYDWNGWVDSETQSLKWPRRFAINYDAAFGMDVNFDFDSTLNSYFADDVIPKAVKDATCELAISLLVTGSYNAEVSGLKLVKVGPIRIDFDNKLAQFSIPKTVIEMLRQMGWFKGSTGGNVVTTVGLVRA